MTGRHLTRRELLAGAGALAGALGLVAAWPRSAGDPEVTGPPPTPTPTPTPSATAAPTDGLRKLIDIGPGGVLNPGSPQDYRYFSNPAYFADTQTRWIRMWADWPSLQPENAYAVDDPRSPGYSRLLALDDQIRRACADGLSVVLMPYRYPAWVNQTAPLAAVAGSDAEVSFQYWDRMPEQAWTRYLGSGRQAAVYNPRRAALAYRLPDEGHGPSSTWAVFFDFLYNRYHYGQRGSGRYVRAFELVNEPNLQLWPQQAPPAPTAPFAPTAPTAARAVADMMATAQAISARHGDSTLMLAPSTSDGDQPSSRRATRYDEFVAQVLDALDAIGYRAHPQQAWSHHNYGDVEYRTGAARTRLVQGMLAGRWKGAAEHGTPRLYVTEGGARVERMTRLYPLEDPRAAQAACLQGAWAAHASAGVVMLAQYLLYTDTNFDSGLLEAYPSTVARPAYATWKSFPA
jgi:hypothetical protein